MNNSNKNTSNDFPIFIVGLSRSGTTLLRKIMNKHSDVWIAERETHYFDDLRVRMTGFEQQPLNPEQIKLCQDYFLALGHRVYGNGGDPEQSWINRTELETLAESLGTGADSYFEAFCRFCAQSNNKIRWGEKTPRHVFRISEILTRYPQAKIICMLRHPGGVVASSRDKWKREQMPDHQRTRLKNSYSIVITILLWRGAFKAALKAHQEFGEERIYIQRFEDLLADPESAIKALTAWLALDYQSSMIEAPSSNSSYSELYGKSGFSKETTYRWQEKLSNAEISTIQYLCGSLLSEAGYEQQLIRHSLFLITWLWITLPFSLLRALLANNHRIANIPQYIWQRFRLAVLQR
ncbi:MAG: sulfotransferase [Symploca sp. SIO2C1]|nr:sulfotransferase [Symploca sp. SIO2C1]